MNAKVKRIAMHVIQDLLANSGEPLEISPQVGQHCSRLDLERRF